MNMNKWNLTTMLFLMAAFAHGNTRAAQLDVSSFFDSYLSAKEQKNDLLIRDVFEEYSGKSWQICGSVNRVALQDSYGTGVDVYIDVARQLIMARPVVTHQLIVSGVGQDSAKEMPAGEGVCAEGLMSIREGYGSADGRLVLSGFVMDDGAKLWHSEGAKVHVIGESVIIKTSPRLSRFFEQ